jgi:DNA-binding NarL/FixJ family response regulator
VLDGHKREEFLIPEQGAHETVNDVTRDLERTLSTRVLGTHEVARALADGGSEYLKGHAVPQAVEQAFDAALTGNAHVVSSEQRVVTQTQIALACEQTKQAEHDAKKSEHAANRERSAAVKDLANNGFSFEQIQALLPFS